MGQQKKGAVAATPAGRGAVGAFLGQLAAMPAVRTAGRRGRLLFAMDATASRERAWDQACQIQSEMCRATAALGGLDVRMAYYRGFSDSESTGWVSDSIALVGPMTAVHCLAGKTQIARVLRHALDQSRSAKVNAVVFVGDALEEDPDILGALAGELGVRGVPVFLFQEGTDAHVESVFRQVARLTGGAWCRFDASSADQLRDLLGAVAAAARPSDGVGGCCGSCSVGWHWPFFCCPPTALPAWTRASSPKGSAGVGWRRSPRPRSFSCARAGGPCS